MPRARANIRAKLRAQMDTGVNLVVITRAPAATSSPAMVRRRGSPAATRLPKAMIRMMIVTGHDSISDLSMADRLAVLKLAHRALSPVSVTETPDEDSAASFGCHRVGRLHHLVGVRGRSGGDDGGPAVSARSRPRPGAGQRSTPGDRSGVPGSPWPRRAWAWGSVAIGPWWSTTTTWRPVAPSPAKFFSMTARAATDWLPEACHPAPASALSTWTAKKPKATMTRSHATSTRRKWVAAHAPSRANGRGRSPSVGSDPAPSCSTAGDSGEETAGSTPSPVLVDAVMCRPSHPVLDTPLGIRHVTTIPLRVPPTSCRTGNCDTLWGMCRAAKCKQCGRPTWKGCGAHVEQVLGDVPKEERCQCRTTAAPNPRRKSWLSR